MGIGGLGRLGHGNRQVIGQGVEHHVLVVQGRGQGAGVGGIQGPGLHAQGRDGRQGPFVAIRHRHLIVATGVQQLRNGVADMAGAEQGDFHGGSSVVEAPA